MPAKLVQQLGTGRRKTATARIFLRPGKGQITVNHRPIENYFVNESARAYVRQPLLAAEMADRFDILSSPMVAVLVVRQAQPGWVSLAP
jgi:small subunit ribosomal protein S9